MLLVVSSRANWAESYSEGEMRCVLDIIRGELLIKEENVLLGTRIINSQNSLKALKC